MPETIILKDGSEREVPTEEEIKELSFRSEERKKQREILNEEKKELQEELLKLSDKDHNFGQLKKQTKEKEDEIVKKQKEVEEAQKVFVERQTDEYTNDALVSLVGDDEEEKKKVLHYYNNELTSQAVTKKEINEKMEKAYRLAVGPAGHNPINTAVNLGGGVISNNKTTESDVSRDIRTKVFNISDDDAKKHGKEWKPNF